MSVKVRKKIRASKSSATAHGFTVVAAPKNPKRRELILADDITTSGGFRSVRRPSKTPRR